MCFTLCLCNNGFQSGGHEEVPGRLIGKERKIIKVIRLFGAQASTRLGSLLLVVIFVEKLFGGKVLLMGGGRVRGDGTWRLNLCGI